MRLKIVLERNISPDGLKIISECPGLGSPDIRSVARAPTQVYELFDKTEWNDIFRELQLKHRSFFPLPDYKLPEAFISEDGHDAPGASAIYGRYVSVNRTPAPKSLAPARLQQNALYRALTFFVCRLVRYRGRVPMTGLTD